MLVGRLVQLCVDRLPSCVVHDDEVTVHTDIHRDVDSDGDSDTSVVSTCLLTSLRLLLNVTHENSQSLTLLCTECCFTIVFNFSCS